MFVSILFKRSQSRLDHLVNDFPFSLSDPKALSHRLKVIIKD